MSKSPSKSHLTNSADAPESEPAVAHELEAIQEEDLESVLGGSKKGYDNVIE